MEKARAQGMRERTGVQEDADGTRPRLRMMVVTGRLRSVARSTWFPWIVVGLITLVVLASWWPTFWVPFGDGRDGGLLGGQALRARNFLDKGLFGSAWIADTSPYTSTYAHHPPLPNFSYAFAAGLLGEGEEQIRLVPYLLGAGAIPAAALALRNLEVRWGPTLLAVGLMVATTFFWIYLRIMRGFTLPLLLVAVIAHLRRTEDPSRLAVWSAALVGAATAAWSWPAAAIAAGLGIWLLARRGLDRVTVTVGTGMLVGFLASVVWVVGIAGLDNLVNQTEFRTSGGGFTWVEFLDRQKHFLRELLPSWYLVLLGPALLAGLWHRMTRVPILVTSLVTVAWGFGLPNGAFIHDYWNFWILAPGVLGMAAGFDLLSRWGPEWAHWTAGVVIGALLVVAFVSVVTGPAQARYFDRPADAGALVAVHQPPESQNVAWFTRGISSPRWLSWYWEIPARGLNRTKLERLEPQHLVVIRLDRLPGWLEPGIRDHLDAREGRYGLARGSEVLAYVKTPVN